MSSEELCEQGIITHETKKNKDAKEEKGKQEFRKRQ
jgi:hypothetical protein